MKIINWLCPIVLISLANPVFSQSETNDGSLWSWIKDRSNGVAVSAGEKSEAILNATKDGASATSNYISEGYSIVKESTLSWTEETYNQFSTDYPAIAENIEAFALSTSENGKYLLGKTKDGALVAYEVSADGVKTVVSWTDDTIKDLPTITACGIAEYDMLGGIAIGTIGTALTAGASTAATTTTIVAVTPTMLGWMPIATFSTSAMAATPAVAIGITAAAIAGASVYATSKGLCYFQNRSGEELGILEIAPY